MTIRLGHGVMAPVVKQAAREVAADVLVLGTHGRSGFIEAIVGSRAESLLFWSPTNTLMVREGSDRLEVPGRQTPPPLLPDWPAPVRTAGSHPRLC